MSDYEETYCCNFWGFSSKIEYDQKDIESMMDDYGGNVILIDNNTGKQKSVSFSNCNHKSLSVGFQSVTMVSDDSLISLVLVFKSMYDGRRKLVSGQLIKYGKIYIVIDYGVYPSPNDDVVAYGRCVYKK